MDKEETAEKETKKRKKKKPQKIQTPPQGGRIKRRYISHPLAEKGLYKITKEGDYLYNVNTSPQKASASVRFAIFDAPDLVNGATGATFTSLYGGNDPIIFIDYEWKLDRWFKGIGSNFSLKVGSGIMIASGKGRLESTGQESKESFTFVMLPNQAALAFKLKIWDKQKLIPYAEGGVGYFVFNEHRDDSDPPLGRFGGAAVLSAVGGLALAVTELDRDATLRLDAEYGINAVWLTAELRQLLGFGSFNMTSTLFSAGVMLHF